VVEQSARFEDIKIPLAEPVHGLEELSAVLGIPEWWPTGSRVAVVLAHDAGSNCHHPLLEHLQRKLTEHKFLTLCFNFPFAETGRQPAEDGLEALDRSYRTAVASLGRDPTAAPAHLFLGGMGLGARIAGRLATNQLRMDGAFFLGFPLHEADAPESAAADQLYRATSPMIFLQGDRDRRCHLDVLKQTLGRVGAPVELTVVKDADEHFGVTRGSFRTDEEVRGQIFDALYEWMEDRLD
jgi:predicted alpha/beta-hydrolase family hydrolase